MKKATPEIKRLKEYLLKSPTRKIELAHALGYSTTNTIDKWLIRGNVPRMARKTLFEIMEGKTE